jgi:biopolymer transport protein ExbD
MTFAKPTIRKARIEIVPMIDTIFFLLVFFMMSTLSMVKMQGLGLAIPKDASSGKGRVPQHITLAIDPKGDYYLNKKKVDVTDLPSEFSKALAGGRNASIVLNVAATQKTQTLVSTMDILNEILTQAGNDSPILVVTPKFSADPHKSNPSEKKHAGR